jgi:DNA-binding CsgD family transcriptional regulator
MAAMVVRLRGRQVQIDTMAGQLDALLAGRGGIIVVRGLPGMGKSSLLAEAARMARARGIAVYGGAGDAAAQVVPLGPLLEALVSSVDPPVDPDILRDLSKSPDQRFWLLRELEESLERAALRVPLLISIDDVQWADPATLHALGTLPRHLAPHRIVWLLAARAGELPPAARAAMTRLEAADAVTITVNPLDDAAAADVAADLIGGVPDDALLTVLGGAGGQPFLLTELVRGMLEESLVEVADGRARLTGTEMPLRFRDSVGRHLARLSDGAQDALRMGAVLGGRFSADELSALLDVPPTAIVASVREAVAAGLVIEDEDRLAFRHDLVREAVDGSLPRTLRQSLRRRAIDVMVRYGAPPADVAELVMEAARPGDRDAIKLLRQAAADTGRVSPTVGSLLSGRALALTAAGDPGRGLLVAETIAYLVNAGQAAEALRLITSDAGDLTDPAAEAEARLALAILSLQYAPADVVEQCRRALARSGVPVALRVQLLSVLSCGLDLAGEVAAAEAPAIEATALARASGDDANELPTLLPRAVHRLAQGDWRGSVDFITDAVTRQHAMPGAAVRLWMPDAWKALILLAVARLDEAFALIDAGARTAQRDGLSASVRIWSMIRCRALLSAGRLADAAAEAEATIEMGDDIGDGSYGYVNHMALYVLGQVALHTGDTAGLAQARRSGTRLRAADRCPATERLGSWLLAMVADAEGDPSRAAQAGVQALDPLAIGPLPGTSPRTYADTAVLTRILVRAGRRGDAALAVGRLEDFAERHPSFPFLDSAAAHARALLDCDPDAALRAVKLSSADPRPLVRAAVLADAGKLLPQARTAEAVPLLERALALYTKAGAERDAARVRSLLRARGLRPASGGPRSSREWPDLTESEFAVASLVARGATNREVADRLYLSPYTVNSHLRHVFAKLGIRSRVELARLAAERGTGG